jgi:hypothetical protein
MRDPGVAVRVERSCRGLHLAAQRRGVPSILALASLVAEKEAGGDRVAGVTLLVSAPSDVVWAAEAIGWLGAHGRRALVRSDTVLSRHLLDAVRRESAAVMLGLAHHELRLQRALLGEQAASSAALLLQAQHLCALGIPVWAHLGPLVPGLHDRDPHLLPLLRHVAAAGIHDAHLSLGRLSWLRLRALLSVLLAEDLVAVRHAFPGPRERSRSPVASADPRTTARLQGVVSVRAREYGLKIDACGCAAQCHLEARTASPYLPVVEELSLDAR